MQAIKQLLVITALSLLSVGSAFGLTIKNATSGHPGSNHLLQVEVFSVYSGTREDVLRNWYCGDIGWEKTPSFTVFLDQGETIELGGINEGAYSKQQYICIYTKYAGSGIIGYTGSSKVLKKSPNCKVNIEESGENEIKTEGCNIF